jgi:hypothetical protein
MSRRLRFTSLSGLVAVLPCLLAVASPAFCQQDTDEVNSKRIFWIIPNFRTASMPVPYKPLTAREKFKIAMQDSFDPGTVALSAILAGQAQLSNSNPAFGQGVKGYAHYLATTYTDFAVGNYMTEAIYPALLHQDPRYFRRGTGSVLSRLGYSAVQIFITHGDNGRTQFNFSEVAGNSTAVAISMAYYPDDRDAADAATKLGLQLGIDMASNIIKEFAPDISRKFHRHRNGD